MLYGYARVSSKEQNEARQELQLREYGVPDREIIIDKESGKDFNRKGWNLLVGTSTSAGLLRDGDTLVITSIDRLGRNYTEIWNMWKHLTDELSISLIVLDMPLLNTNSADGSLDHRFLQDLVLQILSYVAEKERVNIKKRQREGIEAAKLRGKHLGRPRIEKPENWDKVYLAWMKKDITAVSAMNKLNLKPNTFYRLVKDTKG